MAIAKQEPKIEFYNLWQSFFWSAFLLLAINCFYFVFSFFRTFLSGGAFNSFLIFTYLKQNGLATTYLPLTQYKFLLKTAYSKRWSKSWFLTFLKLNLTWSAQVLNSILIASKALHAICLSMDFWESLFNYDCTNVRIVFDLWDLRFGLRIYCCT